MRGFFVRTMMLGLLVCGFALTGDAGWIVSRGQQLLNATTVPTVADLWGRGSDQPPAAPAAAPGPHEPTAWPPVGSQTVPGGVPAPVEVHVAPSLAAPIEQPPADGGQSVVDLRLLRPGTKLRLWIGGSPVAFDIVDPAGGEAIQQPATRRVRIRGLNDPHRIERGSSVIVKPRAGIAGHEPPAERIGPVQSLDARTHR